MQIPISRRGGTGGSDLNFTVVGGTIQPENPKENTIWVNTDQEITGWSIGSEKPTTVFEGLVYIKTSDTGTKLDILNKNQLTICTLIAQQYVSGSWKFIEGKTYSDNSWKQWVTFLYNRGDTCNNITGTWVNTNIRYATDANGGNYLRIAYNSDHILMQPPAANYNSGLFRTTNKIDLTNFKKLVVVLDIVKSGGHFKLYTHSTIGSYQIEKYSSMTTLETRGTGLMTIEVPITTLSGVHYVGFGMYTYSGGNDLSAKIYEVYLQ